MVMMMCKTWQYCEITLPQYNGCSFCAIKSEEGNDAELQTALYRGVGDYETPQNIKSNTIKRHLSDDQFTPMCSFVKVFLMFEKFAENGIRFICLPLWLMQHQKILPSLSGGSLCGHFDHFWSLNPLHSHEKKFKSSEDALASMPLSAFHPISTHLTTVSLRSRLEKPEKPPKSFSPALNFATVFKREKNTEIHHLKIVDGQDADSYNSVLSRLLFYQLFSNASQVFAK